MKQVHKDTQRIFNMFLGTLLKDLTHQCNNIPLQLKIDIGLGTTKENQEKLQQIYPAVQNMLSTGMKEWEKKIKKEVEKIK